MGKYASSYRPMVIECFDNAEYYEIQEGEYLTIWGLIKDVNAPFKRVKIVGFVVNTYISPDRKYGFVIVDDGTSSIRVKFFKDASLINTIKEGEVIAVFGRISKYNDEINIIKEDFVKIENLNYFLLHRMEFMKMKEYFKEFKEKITKENPQERLKEYNLSDIEISLMMGTPLTTTHTSQKEKDVRKEEIKAQIIEYLKQQHKEDGIEYSQISKDLPYNEDIIEEVIVELLSEGSCYEPRPGKIKLL